jgi:hypothetical protein
MWLRWRREAAAVKQKFLHLCFVVVITTIITIIITITTKTNILIGDDHDETIYVITESPPPTQSGIHHAESTATALQISRIIIAAL